MLITLHIQNFTIIEDIRVSFSPGLTVFTGETGAGKSIVVDALGMMLGGRSDSSLIRAGCEQCCITAVFSCDDDSRDKLRHLGIEADDEIIIRRVATRSGSRCYLNDQQVTLNTMKTITASLAAIQGQHAYRTLQEKEKHKMLLDKYGNIDGSKTEAAYRGWEKINTMIAQMQKESSDEQGLELIGYQCQELDEANPVEGEYETLDERHQQLAHSEQLLDNCATIAQQLQGDNGIVAGIASAAGKVRTLTKFAPALGNIAELLDGAAITMQEAERGLRDQIDKINPDPELLRQTENRIQILHELARKHKIKPAELPQKHQQLKTKLEKFNDIDSAMQQLLTQQQQALELYQQHDHKLHLKREQAATNMENEIAGTLHELGMQKSTIEVRIEKTAEPCLTGSDSVEFYARINPGMPATALRKTASGGELARICLAIHSSSPQQQETGTIVFDEIDAGTGGAAAARIGALLQQLAAHTQIFCITHQAQIAATADHHFKIEKQTGQTTTVKADKLDAAQRQQEIARMLAGERITRQSIEHAKEMLGNDIASIPEKV